MSRPETITRDDVLWLLAAMRRVRQTSERIAALYPTNVLETPVSATLVRVPRAS